MAVELRPLGVKCNIACHYCYQEPLRRMGGNAKAYDLDAIKAAVLEKGQPFTLFGGEPLLLPREDLEALFALGLERFGGNAIQTNGVLLTAEHVEMFKTYKVRVGLSLDGPEECNSARWAGSAERTRHATAKSAAALTALIAAGLQPSVIVTLHRFNATAERLPRMLAWLTELDRAGVRFARIHLLEVESDEVQAGLALSAAENAEAMLAIGRLEHSDLRALRLDVFSEIRALLLAQDRDVSCVWRACDPYTTDAVQGIEGHGEASNCGRTNKAGVDYVKAERRGFERYLALYETPQEHGGCAGCRFFLMCKGQCPGTGLDRDWRNRTEHCAVWMELFELVEARLLAEGYVPISRDPNRAVLEAAMLDEWTLGRNPSLAHVLEHLRARAAAPAPADAG